MLAEVRRASDGVSRWKYDGRKSRREIEQDLAVDEDLMEAAYLMVDSGCGDRNPSPTIC